MPLFPSRLSRILVSAAALWCLALPCFSQELLFLKVDTVRGGSRDQDHAGWMGIDSMMFNLSRNLGALPGAGRTIFSELMVTRRTDATSPLLAGEAAFGEGKDVELELVRGSPTRQRYYRLRLKNALVSSFSQSSGGDTPTDTIAFNFTRLDITYTEYLPSATRATTAWFDASLQTGDISVVNSAPNNPPSISTLANTNTPEDVAVTVPFGASDPEGAPLSFSALSDNQTLLPLASMTFGGSGAIRTLQLAPAANQSGTAGVSITVSDGAIAVTRSFALTVSPVNDPPAIATIPPQITLSNTPITVAVNISDVDTLANNLALSAASDMPGVTPGFTFSGSGNSRAITIQPPGGFTGTIPITATVSDGALSSSRSFSLTVLQDSSSNQPPAFLVSDSSVISVISGRWTRITRLLAADPDAGTNLLTLRIAANGALAISNAVGIIVTNNGGPVVSISGSLAALNAVLGSTNGVNYRAPVGASGIDQIVFSLNDNGASGAGGSMQAQQLFDVRFYRSQFEQWQNERFTPAELADAAREFTLWGPNADPDGDGMENLAEYGLNTDPRSPAHARPSAQLQTIEGGRFLTLEIVRRRDPDLQLTIAVASDPAGSWTSDEGAVTASPPQDLGTGFERITFTDRTAATTSAKRFMRMRWSLSAAP